MVQSFCPKGQTYAIASAATAPAGVQIEIRSQEKGKFYTDYQFSNGGAETVFVGWGPDATTAQTNAAEPTAGTPKDCLVLLPGSVQVVRLSSESFISGYSAAANTFYVVIGQGL